MLSGVSSTDFSINRLLAAATANATGVARPATPNQHVDRAEIIAGSNGSENNAAVEGGQPTSETNQSANSRASASSPGKTELTEEEKQQVEKLKQRDAEVRRHEQAHKAAAGSHASGGPTFEYQTGPDGKRYAVGGEVQIDTSEVKGDPQATIAKMQQIRRAANAPAEPSAQDRKVAAQAAQAEQRARRELAQQRAEESRSGNGAAPDASVSPSDQNPIAQDVSAVQGAPSQSAKGSTDASQANRLRSKTAQPAQGTIHSIITDLFRRTDPTRNSANQIGRFIDARV